MDRLRLKRYLTKDSAFFLGKYPQMQHGHKRMLLFIHVVKEESEALPTCLRRAALALALAPGTRGNSLGLFPTYSATANPQGEHGKMRPFGVRWQGLCSSFFWKA